MKKLFHLLVPAFVLACCLFAFSVQAKAESSFTIVNTDEESGEPIEGTVYEVRRVDDSLYTTVVTGPDGKAVVTIDDEIRKELSGNYGNIYLIREKTPGSGYRPVHDTKFVVINVSY